MLKQTTQGWVNHWIRNEILDIAVHVAWMYHYELYQVVISEVETGWRAVVKAHRQKRFYVAFVETETYAETLSVVGYFAAKGCFDWKTDLWPTKYIKRKLGVV